METLGEMLRKHVFYDSEADSNRCCFCDGIIEEGQESEDYEGAHQDCGEEFDLDNVC
jgi:hypothetical protein